MKILKLIEAPELLYDQGSDILIITLYYRLKTEYVVRNSSMKIL